jgi:hypothetical protein
MMNKPTKDQALEQTATSNTDKRTGPECSLKALLASAPLDGIDFDRAADRGRAITLDDPPRKSD